MENCILYHLDYNLLSQLFSTSIRRPFNSRIVQFPLNAHPRNLCLRHSTDFSYFFIPLLSRAPSIHIFGVPLHYSICPFMYLLQYLFTNRRTFSLAALGARANQDTPAPFL